MKPIDEKYIQLENGATFIRKCSICHRYVKMNKMIYFNSWTGNLADKPNAICKKHGKIKMIFMGFNETY